VPTPSSADPFRRTLHKAGSGGTFSVLNTTLTTTAIESAERNRRYGAAIQEADMGYLFLTIAIIEVAGTAALKASAEFTNRSRA
jgi:hypothetical protein